MYPSYYRSAPPVRPLRTIPAPIEQHRSRRPLLIAAIILVLLGSFLAFRSHSAAAPPSLQSAAGNLCIDAYDGHTTAGTPINGRPCRSNAAQDWTLSIPHVKHAGGGCLSVAGDLTANGSPVVLEPCGQQPGQVWLPDQSGLFNPNSGKCLTISSSKPTRQLTIDSCGVPGNQHQVWHSTVAANLAAANSCTNTTAGDRVACYAEKEWETWQTGNPSHEALLTKYTGGTPYEAWCADFVSYVYREAGYAFTNGENNRWNENDANKIQDMGFTMHDPSDYTPKPGDIAYFNYSGGHVEIVVAGGPHPTFIYGNSGAIDPTTGNGDMRANTITEDSTYGQLQYYLSPDHI